MDKSTEERFRSIGPFEVMRSIAKGDLGSDPQSLRWQEAEAWAKAEISALEAASSVARDKREQETLSISRRALAISESASSTAAEALTISRRTNSNAIKAAIWAATATIVAAIIGVIFSVPK